LLTIIVFLDPYRLRDLYFWSTYGASLTVLINNVFYDFRCSNFTAVNGDICTVCGAAGKHIAIIPDVVSVTGLGLRLRRRL